MPRSRRVSLANFMAFCRVFFVAVVALGSVFVLPGGGLVQALVPPDPNFGSNGQLMLPEYGQFLMMSPTGRMTVAGATGSGLELTRVLPDGTFDSSFGGDGSITLDFGAEYYWLWGAVEQSDGKVVLLYSATIPNEIEPYSMTRLNSDGSIDTSFGGAGTGTVDVVLPAGMRLHHYSPFQSGLDIDSSGNIIFGGRESVGTDRFIARYTSSGQPDTSFDGDGFMIPSGVTSNTQILPVDGGKIVARVNCSGACGAQLVRYNADGSKDTTFGDPTFGSGFGDRRVLRLADGRFAVSDSYSTQVHEVTFVSADGQIEETISYPGVAELLAADSMGGFMLDGGRVSAGRQLDPSYETQWFYIASWGDDVKVDPVTHQPVMLTSFWEFGTPGPSLVKLSAPTMLVPVTRPDEDLTGQSQPGSSYAGDPVNTANGNLTDAFTDLDLGLLGTRVVRSYNGIGITGGNLNDKWRVAVGSQLESTGGADVAVRTMDGSRFVFVSDGGSGFVAPDGAAAELVVDPASPVGSRPLPMLRLEHRDGTIERFDTDGQLIEVAFVGRYVGVADLRIRIRARNGDVVERSDAHLHVGWAGPGDRCDRVDGSNGELRILGVGRSGDVHR